MNETKILYCGSSQSGKSESIRSFLDIMETVAVRSDRKVLIEKERLNLHGSSVSLRKIEATWYRPKPFLEFFERPLWLYELEGCVEQNEASQSLLQDVDGVVFVSDANPDKRQENIIAMKALQVMFEEQGGARRLTDEPNDKLFNDSTNLSKKPLVLQFNKCDLSNRISNSDIESDLNWGNYASFDSNALDGTGVIATLSALVRQMYTTSKKSQDVQTERM